MASLFKQAATCHSWKSYLGGFFLSSAHYRGHPQLVLEAQLGQEEGPPLTTGYGAAYTTDPSSIPQEQLVTPALQ